MAKDQLTPEQATKLIRDAVDTAPIGYQCCFCRRPTEGDVIALLLITKWNGPEDKQREQQWFCHAECFIQATGENIDVLETDA